MKKGQQGSLFTLFVLGGYLAYRNRAEIVKWLEDRGIKNPLDTGDKLRESIKAGVARLKAVEQPKDKAG